MKNQSEKVKIPEDCPRCGKKLWGVEYGYPSSESYDGVSEYACPDHSCGYRIGRWTGEEIPEGYVESRFGTRGHVPIRVKEKK